MRLSSLFVIDIIWLFVSSGHKLFDINLFIKLLFKSATLQLCVCYAYQKFQDRNRNQVFDKNVLPACRGWSGEKWKSSKEELLVDVSHRLTRI